MFIFTFLATIFKQNFFFNVLVVEFLRCTQMKCKFRTKISMGKLLVHKFYNWFNTIYTYTNHNQISVGKNCTVSKWRLKTNFCFTKKKVRWPKFKKNIFPKEFFNEIWLKLGDCDYNYIAGIRFWKYYFVTILIFSAPPKMLISAKTAWLISFFFTKRSAMTI